MNNVIKIVDRIYDLRDYLRFNGKLVFVQSGPFSHIFLYIHDNWYLIRLLILSLQENYAAKVSSQYGLSPSNDSIN